MIINLFKRTHQDDDDKLTYLVDDLSSMVKNIRVLPFATVFHFFGRMVRDIAKEKNISRNHLITQIDRERNNENLSSAIRLYVLNYYKEKSGAPK